MTTIHDHGQNDPIPFDLSDLEEVAEAIRRDLEEQFGRPLTDVEVTA